MFISAGECKIHVNAISHLIKHSPGKVTIYFMGDSTLELEGDAASQFITQYEWFVEGRVPDEETKRKQQNLSRRK